MTAPDDAPGPLARDVTVLADAAPLARVLAAIPRSAGVIRVANPLRGPLTLQRLLIQTGQFDLSLPPALALAELLEGRPEHEDAVLLVIEQADSLAEDVMPALNAAVEAHRLRRPTLHVLLVRGVADERPIQPEPASEPPTHPLPPSTPAAPPVRVIAEPPPAIPAPVRAVVEAPSVGVPSTTVSATPPRRAEPEPGSMQAVAAQRRAATSRPAAREGRRGLSPVLWAVLPVLAVALAVIVYVFRARLPFP